MWKPEAPEVFKNEREGLRALRSCWRKSARATWVKTASNSGFLPSRWDVEVKKNVIGMVLVVEAARPRVVVDAAEVGEVQKSGEIVAKNVGHFAAALV